MIKIETAIYSGDYRYWITVTSYDSVTGHCDYEIDEEELQCHELDARDHDYDELDELVRDFASNI